MTIAEIKSVIGHNIGGAMFPLFAPQSFTAVAFSDTQINLSWNAVPNATSYQIDWSPNGTSGWTSLYTGSGTSTSHTGLTASTQYFYRIKATATDFTDSSYSTANETTNASYDADAQAYFAAVQSAGGTINTTNKNAWNAFVVAAKANGYWTKFTVVNPVLGGTSASNIINAKSPGTLNSTANGTITHNSAGITGNGSSGYMNTNVTLQSLNTSGSFLSIYQSTDPGANEAGGIAADNNADYTCIYPRWTATDALAAMQDNDFVQGASSRTGRFILSRSASNAAKLFRNNSQIGSTATGTPSLIGGSTNIYVLANNNAGTANRFNSGTIGFYAIGQSNGLSDAEVALFDGDLSTFITAIGR